MNKQIDLRKHQELASKATPRPWRVDKGYEDMFIWGPEMEMVADQPDNTLRMRGVGAQLPIDQNREFILAAVNDHDAIIEALEAACVRIKELEAVVLALGFPLTKTKSLF